MDIRDEISKVAYELYWKSGRVEGRDLENWLEAEKIVMARYREEKPEAEKPAPKKRASTIKSGTTKTTKKAKK